MKTINVFVLLPVFLIIGHSLFGQGMNSAQIDALVARALETTPSVEIAVAVVKDGAVIHSRETGFMKWQIEQKPRVTNRML